MTMIIQTWVFGKHFHKKEHIEPIMSRKATDRISCQRKGFRRK